jgi:chitinase
MFVGYIGIGNYRKMTAFRQQGMKVSLGIGGWNEGSANYSMMASSPDRRKAFIASSVEFLKYIIKNYIS